MTKPSAQPAPTDPPAFVLLNEIGIIEQLARARFEALQTDGLLLPHFTLLNHLVRVGDGRSPVAIARALQLAKGAITNTLQRLEARGLVRVEPDPEDGRGKRVFLTAAGRRRRDAAVAIVAPALAEAIAGLDAAALAETIARLRLVRESLDRARG